MKTILAPLLAVFLAGSLTAAEDAPLSVSLERTVCYGFCPSYVLTLLADGTVTFEGREHVKSKGIFEKKIAPSALIPIFKKIEAIHFWELEDRYRGIKNPDGTVTMVSDLPTQIVTVKSSAKTKRVEDYNGAPADLRELEKLIDEVAGVSEWVGTPKERKP